MRRARAGSSAHVTDERVSAEGCVRRTGKETTLNRDLRRITLNFVTYTSPWTIAILLTEATASISYVSFEKSLRRKKRNTFCIDACIFVVVVFSWRSADSGVTACEERVNNRLQRKGKKEMAQLAVKSRKAGSRVRWCRAPGWSWLCLGFRLPTCLLLTPCYERLRLQLGTSHYLPHWSTRS